MAILLKNPSKEKGKRTIPLVPLRHGVVFPHTEALLTFGRASSTTAINKAFKDNRVICFVSQKDPSVDTPKLKDIYRVGTVCSLRRILKTNDEVNTLVKGVSRVRIENLRKSNPFLLVDVSPIPEVFEQNDQIEALVKHLQKQLKKAVSLGLPVDFMVFMKLMSGVEPSELVDQIAAFLDIENEKKQELLETVDVQKRMEKVSDHLSHQLKILEIENSIKSKTQKKFDKSMRRTILKEKMKTIQKELGNKKEKKEVEEFKKKIKKANMPKEVKKKADKELGRLAKMHTYNPEAGHLRTYLEWLTEMPWGKMTPNDVAIKEAKKVLENDHYGLKEVKERILEYLAVMKLKKSNGSKKNKKKDSQSKSGPTILCFVGAPGVGKTSMGKSIAHALGRKFIRVSLGGIRDEAEIRGHRRTYIGALPGRIIQGIKDSQTQNPVFMLDEIDKVGNDFRGDPSAALLEALDPEQNSEFSDHYLEVPFDLSQVMFITTANVLDTIPPALKDRLEIIRFSGYTYDEKYKIAKKFLIKKTLEANGLKKGQIKISDAVIKKVIERYTREAGVRNLEREISKLMRKSAVKIAKKEADKVNVTMRNLNDFLGPYKFTKTLAEEEDDVGISTGLAWTQSGGDILFIEVALMPGKGKVVLTGQLGDVMKESCRAALSYVRSNWKKLGVDEDSTKKIDVHVHVPEGAVKKDGPSAGVAIVTALASALTDKKVRREVGMTGEITLRGRVLEIGGVKEKVIAAHQAGLKEIILPKNNQRNLVKVPKKIQKDFKFHFVESLDEVLKIVLKQK